MFPRPRVTSGIEIEPDPPAAGQGAVVTVPHSGEWYVYVTDANGNVTALGPFRVDDEGKLDIPVPASAGGSTLTVTDEGEPIPTDGSFPVVSTH